MTDEMMVLELARIDGYKYTEYDGGWWGLEVACGIVRGKDLPDYLNSHDAVQSIIDGMDDETIADYDIALCLIIKRDTGTILNTTHKATARQKAEAILKAYGRWM